ncbi:MAG: leukotriene A4 hydrolase C-terminal domain-containing protein, partial [Chloroflexi bacterium]|nr:leukotriene A4 hydrolase C-terminal domain-containing protein [Chloroflexota bacterium]
RNYQLLTYFYRLSIRSGHQDVLSDVEKELGMVGRGLFIYDLYRALAAAEWSNKQARPFFERFKSRYHPIVSKRIGDILAEAGV